LLLRSSVSISNIFARYVCYRTDIPADHLIENPTQNYPAAWNKGAAMATQTDSSRQPTKSRANSEHRIAKNAQPEIVASTAAKVAQHDVGPPLTDEQRRELIAVAAYYLAESRNFQPGHEDEDWLAAEVRIGSRGALVS
jgi:hypothetical protein